MMRSFALFAVLLLAGSCQTYDFERVVPLAVAQTTDKTIVASKRLKPNVMLLVDNSGSMMFPTNPTLPACQAGTGVCATGGNPPCPATCPTRISELKNAMATFLQTSGTIARLGLTVFPQAINGTAFCDPSTETIVPLPARSATDDGTDSILTTNANAVNARIQALAPTGGTPTGSSLDFLGTSADLNYSTESNNDFRDDFILLLTDGLPNCNRMNPHNLCGCTTSCSQAQQDTCNCTTAGCTNMSLCSLGCLDQDGAVQSVKALRQKGIRTVVVGFGAELVSGVGPAVLNAMAREGGFARECPNMTDAECGGAAGSCNTSTKQCSTSFFQAANGTELAAALRKISESFQGDPCVFKLSATPSDPRYLSVVINGQSLAAGPTTYSYDPGRNEVTFVGALCTQLNSSTTQNPVNVEFRIVERL